jgi:hypothetical protein
MKGKYTDAIRKAVQDLGHLASPYYLKQLGYTQRQIEKAVADGAICWTRNGDLRAC